MKGRQTWLLMAMFRSGCGRATPMAVVMRVVNKAIVERQCMAAAVRDNER